jgi:Transposase DDE domain
LLDHVFSLKSTVKQAKAVMDSLQDGAARVESLAGLSRFRQEFYECLPLRRDALFELTEAVLCAGGPVGSLVQLSLEPVHRRGHGALYDALASGSIDTAALAGLLARSWQPADQGPVKIAVDVSAWPRPHAATSGQRCFCHSPCRCSGTRKAVAGWPYSFAAGLEWGRSSWTALLDAERLTTHQDATLAAVGQVTRIRQALDQAGHLTARPAPLFVFDAGYDLTRISYLLAQQTGDIQVLGRVKSNRVYRADPVQRPRHLGGRPRRHGAVFKLADPATWTTPDASLTCTSDRYGTVTVRAWHRLHQELEHDRGWTGHPGELPVVPATLLLIEAQHLPGGRDPKPMWLWHTTPTPTAFDLDLLWRTYLRRFDIEHTFRLLKQDLGWTAPQIRTPEQGDRWTWLILAAHTQLRLARHLTHDLRRPWEKPTPTGRTLTPGRVRRGFPHLARTLGTPARPAKPTRPGPGRPPGTTRPPRQRHPVVRKPQSKRDKKRT